MTDQIDPCSSLRDKREIQNPLPLPSFQAFLSEDLPETVFGAPKAGPGQWASCVRLLDPIKGEILQLIKLEQNEAAVSMTLVRFANWPDALYCLVGVAKDLHLNPRSVGMYNVIFLSDKLRHYKRFILYLYILRRPVMGEVL